MQAFQTLEAPEFHDEGSLRWVGEADELTRKINELTRLLKEHLRLPILSNDYNFHMFDYL